MMSPSTDRAEYLELLEWMEKIATRWHLKRCDQSDYCDCGATIAWCVLAPGIDNDKLKDIVVPGHDTESRRENIAIYTSICV